MITDLKFALRQLLKSPGFTAISIITLALGIGLNTSMFSLMNMLLLQPLPFSNLDELVRVHRTTPQSQSSDHTTPDALDLAREAAPFADLAAYRLWSLNLAESGRPPVNLNALRVSQNFFSILGIRPELGRFFNPEEDQPGSNVLVLSHGTWQAQFGGDPDIIGRTVRINGHPTVIIGVAPTLQGSLFLWGPGDVYTPWAPTVVERNDRDNAGISVLGRRKSGLSIDQVNARLGTLAEQFARNRPREQSQDGLRAVDLQSSLHNAASTGLSWLLLGLAGFVLLIACGNLANLQLARAIARGHEFAIRAALGASRSRLLRPLLCESLLLALGGGAIGVLVAIWANDWLSSRLSANGFATIELHLDWRVLTFAVGISAFTGVVFGLVPAWLMSRIRVNDALKSGTRGNTGDRAQHRLRHSLIVGQFALALVLLVGAGLFIRGFDRMLRRDAGWNSNSVLQTVINLPQAKYATPEQTYAFYRQAQERLSGLPGVEQVAIGWTLPVFQFLTSRNFMVEGRDPPAAGREPLAFVNGVTPTYLPTMQIPLIAGRNFTDDDKMISRPVVIISQSMAQALFPNEDPLGRSIGSTDPNNRSWAEIVGVMPDQRSAISITSAPTQFQVFKPLAQETWNYVTIAIRASNPEALVDPMRRVLAELDPDLPLQQVGTVEQMIERGASGFHMTNTLLLAFALLGLFLSALGLYGVIARLVVQRTPEIGVRLALGAQGGDVIWLILRSGLRLTLFGTVLGLVFSFGLVRVIRSFLPDLAVNDPVAIASVTLLLLVIALVACWLPARRATKVDPLVALRAE